MATSAIGASGVVVGGGDGDGDGDDVRTVLLCAPRLRVLVDAVLVALGVDARTSDDVATHLVDANLCGHDSHGVGMLPTYAANVRRGVVRVDGGGVRTLRDGGALLLFDGAHAFGQRVGREACEAAIERCRTTGVVCFGLRRAHHIGRVGAYAEQCARAGLVATFYVNVVGHPPYVAPHGGREPRIVTNPFCAALPRRDGAPPVVLDMATSALALGKVRVAYNDRRTPLPDDTLLDGDGAPSNDPALMFERTADDAPPPGVLLPFGAHKGSGLGMMCELLGGALAAQWTQQPAHERAASREDSGIVNNWLAFVVDPRALYGGDDDAAAAVDREAAAMIAHVRSTPPRDGFDRVRMPGDVERENEAQRRRSGIPLSTREWRSIVDVARAAAVEPALIDAAVWRDATDAAAAAAAAATAATPPPTPAPDQRKTEVQ